MSVHGGPFVGCRAVGVVGVAVDVAGAREAPVILWGSDGVGGGRSGSGHDQVAGDKAGLDLVELSRRFRTLVYAQGRARPSVLSTRIIQKRT